MNSEDIERLKKEAGYIEYKNGCAVWADDFFERFAALVAAAEREACAKWLEDKTNAPYLAEQIRARGQE